MLCFAGLGWVILRLVYTQKSVVGWFSLNLPVPSDPPKNKKKTSANPLVVFYSLTLTPSCFILIFSTFAYPVYSPVPCAWIRKKEKFAWDLWPWCSAKRWWLFLVAAFYYYLLPSLLPWCLKRKSKGPLPKAFERLEFVLW